MLSKRLVATIAALALGLVAASAADAKGRKKKKKTKKAPVAVKVSPEHAKALGQLMGPFKFGMSKERVIKVLAKQINEKYAEKIKEANDIYAQDKLRKRKKKEIARIKSSIVEFKGKKTGWDVSIIDDEFEHKTGESMMVYWENAGGKDQRRFFFFYEGRLWKMFIALNSNMLKRSQRSFAFFQRLMEQRYGPGRIHTAMVKGAEEPTHISWKTSRFRVRAIDKLRFYGNFCLSISDQNVEGQLVSLRESVRPAKKKNRIIEAVVSKDNDDDTPGLEENSSGVDAILGGD